MSGPTGRLLVVSNDFPPRAGGIESFVLAMVQRLPRDRVVVHTARQPGATAFDAGLDLPVVRDPARVLLPTAALTRRVLATARRHGCDRVWFGAAAPLALMADDLRAAGIRRSVATTHGHEVWWSRLPGSRAALRRIGDSTDHLTYLGEFTRRRIAPALSPAARERMVRLAPGVDVETFAPGAGGTSVRAELGLGDAPVVVCVARLVTRKGQDVLVRALPEVRRQVPGTRLLLVGDGPARPRLARLVHRHGLQAAVVLTGQVPWASTPRYHAAGDVFAMPARTRLGGLEPEALGICFLEAAACGRAVVAGRSGGVPDALLDGTTGLLVDGRDVDKVSAALVRLLRSPAERTAMGERGRAWVRAQWGWQRQVDTLRDLLRLS